MKYSMRNEHYAAAIPAALITPNLIEEFVATQDIAPSSRTTYRHCLEQFLKWIVRYNYQELTRASMLRYKTWLDEQQMSVFTKSLYIIVIRRLFAWAEEHTICANITHGLKNPKRHQKSHHKDSLHVAQVKLLFAAIDRTHLRGLRDFALINILVRTGLRLKEVAHARCADIEYQGDQARLWVRGKGRHGKDEFVVLTPQVLTPLTSYLTERKVTNTNYPLFASLSDRNYGKPLTTFSLSRIIRNYLIEAGIKSKRVTAHSLRHTFGVLSMQAGASLYEVQLAMRHAAPSTTQVYLGDIEQRKRLEASPEHKINTLLNTEGV